MKRVTTFEYTPNQEQQTILGSLTYATSKLWNVGNYQRIQWSKESGEHYPEWYQQKKTLKEHDWYKALPSQSAQEVLNQLDQAWKSYYKLKETGSIKNAKPPRYKYSLFNIRFLNNGFQLQGHQLRLSLPKKLKQHLIEKYQMQVGFLFLPIPKAYRSFQGDLKMIEIMPLSNHKYKVNMIIESQGKVSKENRQQEVYMSIDFGVNNLMTCYLSTGKTLIISGRQLLSINRYFDKTISYYQSISDTQQSARGIPYPKKSKRVHKLFEKRSKQVKHLLHAATKTIVEKAIEEGVTKVILGDITKIREEKNLGKKNNQKFHRLPYKMIETQLKYKLEEQGIELVKQEESYTSQCSPYSAEVSEKYAEKVNRKTRGLYIDQGISFNADCVGAYNILRKYLCRNGKPYPAVVALDTPVMYRWNQCCFIENPKLANSLAM
jgi:putative transposase